MNDMALTPGFPVGLWNAASRGDPVAGTGKLTVDAARTPAAATSISLRDMVGNDAWDIVAVLKL
jgi:hypothetical protein